MVIPDPGGQYPGDGSRPLGGGSVDRADSGSGALRSVRVVVGRGLESAEVATELARVLADRPSVVLCDLAGMSGTTADLREVFVARADQLIGWPGVVVVVVSSDPEVRGRLRDLPSVCRLVVTDTREKGEAAASALLSSLRGAELTLAPDLAAPRAARVFVGQTMLDWDLSSLVAPACLVVSELVTNSVVHAATDMRLMLSRMDGRVLVAVRDRADGLPEHKVPVADEGQDGRGLVLVDAFAHDWGVVPATSGGKTVWALLAPEEGPTDPGWR